MALLTSTPYRLSIFSTVLSLMLSGGVKAENGTMAMSALIDNDPLNCELSIPQNVLSFDPLLTSQVTGTVTTYQIKPLRLKLACIDTQKAVQPMLTIEGETPYSNVAQNKVFLNGTPNGVGFMLRQSENNKPIALSEFYSPGAAIGAGGHATPLMLLNEANQYQGESLLWVGLVGPLQPQVLPGQFNASLIINVAFQ